MIKIISAFVFYFCVLNSYAWNAMGHKVIAQIAYDNLSPDAKNMCEVLLHSHRFKSLSAAFVTYSTWMDQIRYKKIAQYDAMHYIDRPFSVDGSSLPPIAPTNAVWGIKKASDVLSEKNTKHFEKRLALLMLIHIIADIHQPLHAVTRVSAVLPKGDLGGNLFILGKNPVGTNLHQYWDRGAGFFLTKNKARDVKNRARSLEQKWSCDLIDNESNPEKWAKTSYELAVSTVYQLNPYDTPSKKYQANAKRLVQKQAAYAGCRLAALLNKIAQA